MRPATLAGDVQIFATAGYDLLDATPIDRFPKMRHEKTVVYLSSTKL
jgi:tRNA/tmRNA/rRNA uracil-C5-methylase (TrmA/RlmC/RlmD family)